MPVQSQRAYQALLLECECDKRASSGAQAEYYSRIDDKLFVQLHSVATTAYSNATVLSLRVDRHVKLDGVEDGVLPYNDTSLGVYLGTTASESVPSFAHTGFGE